MDQVLQPEWQLEISDPDGPICRGWESWRLGITVNDQGVPVELDCLDGVQIMLGTALDEQNLDRLRGDELTMRRLQDETERRAWPSGSFLVVKPINPEAVLVAFMEPERVGRINLDDLDV